MPGFSFTRTNPGASLLLTGFFRFTGNLHAMAEGTLFFADEPILRLAVLADKAVARRDT